MHYSSPKQNFASIPAHACSAVLMRTWVRLIVVGVLDSGVLWCTQVHSGVLFFSGTAHPSTRVCSVSILHDSGSLDFSWQVRQSYFFSLLRNKSPLGFTQIHFLPKTGFPGSCCRLSNVTKNVISKEGKQVITARF